MSKLFEKGRHEALAGKEEAAVRPYLYLPISVDVSAVDHSHPPISRPTFV